MSSLLWPAVFKFDICCDYTDAEDFFLFICVRAYAINKSNGCCVYLLFMGHKEVKREPAIVIVMRLRERSSTGREREREKANSLNCAAKRQH